MLSFFAPSSAACNCAASSSVELQTELWRAFLARRTRRRSNLKARSSLHRSIRKLNRIPRQSSPPRWSTAWRNLHMIDERIGLPVRVMDRHRARKLIGSASFGSASRLTSGPYGLTTDWHRRAGSQGLAALKSSVAGSPASPSRAEYRQRQPHGQARGCVATMPVPHGRLISRRRDLDAMTAGDRLLPEQGCWPQEPQRRCLAATLGLQRHGLRNLNWLAQAAAAEPQALDRQTARERADGVRLPRTSLRLFALRDPVVRRRRLRLIEFAAPGRRRAAR